MAEQQTVAESSPAETIDVFNGETPTLAEFQHYRDKGEVPERFKQPEADSTPADTQEETEKPEGDEPETEPASEPEDNQEQLGPGAKKRIKQLLAKIKELETKPAEKQDVTPAPSTVQQPQGKPQPEDKNPDGTPKYATYEDFTEAVIDWKTDQKVAKLRAEQAEQEALKALSTTMEEARTRYEDADDVIFPTAQTIREAKIPQAVKEIFAGSDYFIDLCYVAGSDPDELEKFVSLAQKNPRAAIAKVFEWERGVKEELAKPRGEDGKFVAAPGPKKTAAPKPVTPVSGASSRAFDVSDESLSADEWFRKRNQQVSSKV